MSGGGVTISGGEPLMQPDFLFTLLESLQPIHRIVETCGYAPPNIFRRLLIAVKPYIWISNTLMKVCMNV